MCRKGTRKSKMSRVVVELRAYHRSKGSGLTNQPLYFTLLTTCSAPFHRAWKLCVYHVHHITVISEYGTIPTA